MPLRFPGQYRDAETGLHYNNQRYYDPQTARYLSPDPHGLATAPNPVAYVSNPHGWTDPLGLAPTKPSCKGSNKKTKSPSTQTGKSSVTVAVVRTEAQRQPQEGGAPAWYTANQKNPVPPGTNQFTLPDNKGGKVFDFGHKPGCEHRRWTQAAQHSDLPHEDWRNAYNDPNHYTLESSSGNQQHGGEDTSPSWGKYGDPGQQYQPFGGNAPNPNTIKKGS